MSSASLYSLSDLALSLNGVLHGDGSVQVSRPCHPAKAETAADLAVAMDRSLLALLPDSPARSAVVSKGARIPEGALDGWIEIPRPRYAMAGITGRFAIPHHVPQGIHPQAVIHPDAEIGENVSIGPFCYVGRGARIGAGTRIQSDVYIGTEASIGPDGLVMSGVRIGDRVRIGARVILHFGASIGADGFSFVAPDLDDMAAGDKAVHPLRLARIHSLAAVELGDDVEIGGRTCIDRGTLDHTRVGDGTKIDDLVMLGHNVQIGSTCMLCAQVGIAGSVKVGDRVVLAGGVTVADHRSIGSDSVVAAKSCVIADIEPRSVFMAYPALERNIGMQIHMHMRRLDGIFDEVRNLKKAFRVRKAG
ncbi:MAG: UDP-3-O-(3-hydroxymyristoyl)glucosamine N-acyltransferase [Rhodospirillaceae bacterium]